MEWLRMTGLWRHKWGLSWPLSLFQNYSRVLFSVQKGLILFEKYGSNKSWTNWSFHRDLFEHLLVRIVETALRFSLNWIGQVCVTPGSTSRICLAKETASSTSKVCFTLLPRNFQSRPESPLKQHFKIRKAKKFEGLHQIVFVRQAAATNDHITTMRKSEGRCEGPSNGV